MMRINKKSKKKTNRKIAFVSMISLIFNLVVMGISAPSKDILLAQEVQVQMCESPVDVVLIMDKSGSMDNGSPTKLSQAKNSAKSFVDNLGVNDQSALVSYESTVTLDKGLSVNHSDTKSYINSLVANGGTNIGDAIYKANVELGSENANPKAVKVAILLTDGRATCPFYDDDTYSECGRDDDGGQIDNLNKEYAINAATDAAALGYKIFTIGLGNGNDINIKMLEDIATITGASYYFTPDVSQLNTIYTEISQRLCEYGSISGYKYEKVEPGIEPVPVSNWEINLQHLTASSTQSTTQLTDENGYYQFSGLLAGNYTVSEGENDGILFEQVFPASNKNYSVSLSEGENVKNKNFTNYFPICGNNILDSSYGEECDDGNMINGDGCSDVCKKEEKITVIASKIVCDDETDLPNWGGNTTPVAGEPNYISSTTAQDYVDHSQGKCHLVDGWSFQIGENKNDDRPIKYNGDYYGEASSSDGWTTFGPTDNSGKAQITVALTQNTKEFRLREILQSGYIPFSYDNIIKDNTDDVSAEFYCASDIHVYDNYDYIRNPQAGETYYCVAFNVLNPLETYQCSDEIDNDGDALVDAEDPGCWTDPENSETYVPTDNDEYNSLINYGDVIINELMWMGSASRSSDEWIELKNTTDSQLDLTGCQLTKNTGAEELMLTFPDGAVIDANGYYLASNYGADSSNIDIYPELVDPSIALSNTKLQIKLYCNDQWNSSGDVIDIAGNGEDPLNMAGDKGNVKKSMTRRNIAGDGSLADNWCTAITRENWDTETTELGTPGSKNVCNLISGYKFNDLNNNGIWEDDEVGMNNWKIELYQGGLSNLIDTTTTIAEDLGYYEFNNLIPGNYFVKEVNQHGWQQTVPTSPNYYEINLIDSSLSENNNFGNYQELTKTYQCSDEIDNDGDALVDAEDPGCWTDSENSETYVPTDNDENQIPVIALTQPILTINIGDSFDPENGHATAKDTEDGDITPDMTNIGIVDTNIEGTYYIDYNVLDSKGVAAKTKTLEVVVVSQGCTSNCGGGGGGTVVIPKPTIIITNEKVEYLGDGKAKVTWTTNIETTEQVVYGDNSVSVFGNAPKYGYDLVSEESISMTKQHSVIITGLTDGITYFFRPVADRNGSTGEKVGIEVFYEVGEVKGVEAPEIPCDYLLEYIKLGENNNPVEVKKLEQFLNDFEGEKLAVNGIYEQVDFDAVSRFQKKYMQNILSPWNYDSSTGYVYITTKKMINELYCQREFTLSDAQKAEISSFNSKFANTLNGSSESLNPSEEGLISENGIGETSQGFEKEEVSENGEEEILQGDKEGKVAGVQGENGDQDINKKSDDKNGTDVVYAENGSSSLYFWILALLLIIIIGVIYYMTNIRRKSTPPTQ